MKLTGNADIEDSLGKLDKLTKEEARMASAEMLKTTCSVDDRVKSVEGEVQDVRRDVHDVGNEVQDDEAWTEHVHGDVQDVDYRVQSIGSSISSRVQLEGVDEKLDQVNRSLSL